MKFGTPSSIIGSRPHSEKAGIMMICLAVLVLLSFLSSLPIVHGNGDDKKFLYQFDKNASQHIIEVTEMDGFFHTSMKHRIVEFYSPGCGACRNFKPKYVDAARRIHEKYGNDHVEFYGVSCSGMNELCRKYEIRGYPWVFAIPENKDFVNDRFRVKHFPFFTARKIEKVLGLAATTGRELYVEEDDEVPEEEEEEKDDETPEDDEDDEDEPKDDNGQNPVAEDDENGQKSDETKEDSGEIDEQIGDEKELVEGDNGKSSTERKVTVAVPEAAIPEDANNSEEDQDEDVEDENEKEDEEEDEDEKEDENEKEDEKEDENENEDDDEKSEPIAADDAGKNEPAGVDDEDFGDDDDKDLGKDTEDSESTKWKDHAEVVPMRREAGAATAKDKKRSMDKWKEVQKQRIREKEYKWLRQNQARPGSIGHELVHNPEAATKRMKANRRGTEEFNDRQKEFLKVVDRMKKTKRRNRREAETKRADRKPPIRKNVTKPGVVEKLPVLKHIRRMGREEELILDASLSFIEGLKMSVFKTNKALSGKEKRVLEDWLELLGIALPQEWALHEIIGDLHENIDYVSKSHDNLVTTIKNHPFPRRRWSKSCSENNPMSCGFWKLLHIMTIGIAEHRGGRDLLDSGFLSPDARLFSPLEAADTVREYMALFFPCTECSKHFVSQYDQCEVNRRCDRLVKDVGSASDADWKELANWLWEFHNEVNVRLLNEKSDDKRKKKQRKMMFKEGAGPGQASLQDEVQVLWPSITDCIVCFHDDGSYNEEAVFLHLERTYWPGHDLTDTPRRLITFEDDGEGAIGLNLILLMFAVFVVLILRMRIMKASVSETILRAKAMGVRVVDGGKRRTT